MQLIFEKSKPGRIGLKIAENDVPQKCKIPKEYMRKEDCPWPEVTELDVVRHFTNLSKRNFSVDANFYPLGSCTMKYNPRFTEKLANAFGFADLHPLLAQLKGGEQFTQGALELLYETGKLLCAITAMAEFTMQPLAGAHGELTGVMLMAAYHKAKGRKRKYIIVPDSAHGTNPASAAIAGYEIISVPSDKNGVVDLRALKEKINDDVAGMMLTCPNTLGLFNSNIDKIAQMIHEVDGLMYYDGANLNALLGRARPGDLGFDIVHINLHKTFSTPHGGGGPGAGPVGVCEKLVPYLPISRVCKKEDGSFFLNYDFPQSIGYIASFYGNFAVILKAYAYILLLGKEGLGETSRHAVLNANYLMHKLKPYYDLPYEHVCMHECVFSLSRQCTRHVHALDVAKYLIDQGIHPPTVYFPLIVKEAMMIEPTETESKETIDLFVEAMIRADQLSRENPGAFKNMPKTTPVSRPDEVKAAKELNCNFFKKQ